MADGTLFGADFDPILGREDSISKEPARGTPRVQYADRRQGRWEQRFIDDLIPQDHRARTLWLASERLDLSEFYAEIQSVESHAGRPAIDPRIPLVLWLYAISEGVGSARQLSRLCKEHDAYRWIAGGRDLCHRLLSDFRVRHGAKLDRLLTELLAALMKAGVITLRRVAQDGTKVRASAGAASFRRRNSLKLCLQEAQQQVQILKTQLDDADETTKTRKRAAHERAAREREESVKRALEALNKVEESRRRHRNKNAPRASTTDPDARVMKMSDGGYRPAYNCQIATDVDSRLIIATRASNSGGDMGQIEPTLAEIQKRLGAMPQAYFVDGGYAKRESIEHLSRAGIAIYAPPQHKPEVGDPNSTRRRVDSTAVKQWKERMQTVEGKESYRLRAASIETINGDLKDHRGLTRFRVRGIDRVQSVLLLSVLTYNIMRAIAIAPQLMLPSGA